MNVDNFFQTKLFKGIILGIGAAAILSFVFSLGVFIGLKRADFSFRWADEYHRNFGGPSGGIFGDFMGMGREFADANGSFGQIINIDTTASTLTIKDVSNVEKNILVSGKTTIIYQRKNIKLSDLKLDDSVVVIGEPNNYGQIAAELIRVMPQRPANSNSSPSPSSQSSQQN